MNAIEKQIDRRKTAREKRSPPPMIILKRIKKFGRRMNRNRAKKMTENFSLRRTNGNNTTKSWLPNML